MSYKISTILATLTAALMLSACSAVTVHQPSPDIVSCSPPSGFDLKLNASVRYYAYISTLSASEIVTEYNAASQNFSKSGSNVDRIKLAMLLSLPNTPFHSTTAAIALLKNLPEKPAASSHDLNDFVLLLGALLAKQQQTDETLADLAKALATEKAHARSLQEKIDAIKSFEIHQTHRDQP
jgi:hypothetical protein